MSADLAPELLRWLATVLAPVRPSPASTTVVFLLLFVADARAQKYHNVNRTYSDVAALLHHYRSLSPKTDVYTYDDGRSDLLLCLHGTLPVPFRGATYNIPLNIWVSHQYPNVPPTVMVVPGKNLGIRPTINVDTNGRCYHPYLAYWSQNPDKSTLFDLCSELKTVFSKEPPLYSKQTPPAVEPSPGPGTPPPRPPLPQEIESQRARAHAVAHSSHVPSQQSPAPLPPPKAEPQQQAPAPHAYTTTPHLYVPQTQPAPHPIASPPIQSNQSQQSLPERPALPQKVPSEEVRGVPLVPTPGYQQFHQDQQPPPVPPIPPPIRNPTFGSPEGPYSPPPPPQHSVRYQQPASPPVPPIYAQHQGPPQPALQAHRLSGQYDTPVTRFPIAQSTSPRPISFHGYPNHHLTPAPGPSKFAPQPSKAQPKSQFNLLDVDDAGMLPVSAANTAPPPLPPNPEKDRLINEIAKVIQQKADAAATKTIASLDQTASQADAMAKTEAYMERERMELIRINDICEKDQRILNDRIGMADDLIREVRDREAPNIDAVVVAPTVVHNQLYELVTDDMAIEDTIYVLGKALDKERITLDVFLKVSYFQSE
ncbi:hypothetical protein H072_772 [Dactylellina haptotyla CBS 200.50]|uniref:UEV domain-containing protein n=1 Tax=Dactylellina haptotyla (strain CBS 200.50) TaxID=1284197 RepID=S8AWA1_DACHA|nr:hypothetical protein H072_772 [Dactylellina haptotyla CBS 200.50]